MPCESPSCILSLAHTDTLRPGYDYSMDAIPIVAAPVRQGLEVIFWLR